MQKWMLNKRVRYRLVNITILSIRFSWSEKRSSVRTLGETLEERLELHTIKMRPGALSQARMIERYGIDFFGCKYSDRT
jgi:hypothetical protein